MSDPAYERRDFLNLPGHGGLAAVNAWVNRAEAGYNGSVSVDAGIDIGACARSITLDFDLWLTDGDESGDTANMLHKMDRLIGTLTDMRAAYLREIGRAEALLAANKNTDDDE